MFFFQSKKKKIIDILDRFTESVIQTAPGDINIVNQGEGKLLAYISPGS